MNPTSQLLIPEVSELITEFCELLHLEMTQAQRDQLLNEHFDAADKNRDSVLTLDEFRDFAALLDTAALICAVSNRTHVDVAHAGLAHAAR